MTAALVVLLGGWFGALGWFWWLMARWERRLRAAREALDQDGLYGQRDRLGL